MNVQSIKEKKRLRQKAILVDIRAYRMKPWTGGARVDDIASKAVNNGGTADDGGASDENTTAEQAKNTQR